MIDLSSAVAPNPPRALCIPLVRIIVLAEVKVVVCIRRAPFCRTGQPWGHCKYAADEGDRRASSGGRRGEERKGVYLFFFLAEAVREIGVLAGTSIACVGRTGW